MNVNNGIAKSCEFSISDKMLKKENDQSIIKQVLLSTLVEKVQSLNSSLVKENIETGWTSVSEMVSIRQFSPFIVGDTIKIKSKVFRTAGRRIFISSSISNAFEIVAEAREERKVVNIEAFNELTNN